MVYLRSVCVDNSINYHINMENMLALSQLSHFESSDIELGWRHARIIMIIDYFDA